MKKDSSTESWGKIEMTDEWIQLAQTNPHRIHFIMPFTFKQLGSQIVYFLAWTQFKRLHKK